MASLLLHNSWVYVYLICAGALWTAVLWDRLRNPLEPRNNSFAGPAKDRNGRRQVPLPPKT